MAIHTLEGRTALVTGSTRGIGNAVARRLAAEGARVVLHGRDRTGVDEAVRATESAFGVVGKVEDPDQVAAMCAEAVDAVGPIDIVVNNAGTSVQRWFLDGTDEEWDHLLAVNLHGPRNVLRALLPGMRGFGSASRASQPDNDRANSRLMSDIWREERLLNDVRLRQFLRKLRKHVNATSSVNDCASVLDKWAIFCAQTTIFERDDLTQNAASTACSSAVAKRRSSRRNRSRMSMAVRLAWMGAWSDVFACSSAGAGLGAVASGGGSGVPPGPA
jgi:NAD(P)-dependent dehydrogenase (short-subunit alcohol dehydrogenase family)